VTETDRRVEYRVARFEQLGLKVTLLVGDRRVSVELLDTTYSGAGILVGPSFEGSPGLPVLLEFEASALDEPMLVQGVVRHASETFSGQRLGIAFRDARELDGQLPSALVPIFNRRNCFRVTPMTNPGILVKCTAMEGHGATLRLLDLSLTGLGLIAGLPEERILRRGEVTTVRMDLPGGSAPIVALASVVYEEMLPGGLRYGARFIPDQCDDFQSTEKAIGEYILNRQRSVLRRP